MEGTRIKVAAVSNLNTLPFIYGLQNHEIKSRIEMEVVHPAECAEKLVREQVDIGLVPVVVLPEVLENGSLFDFGIAADGKVRSVIMYSNVAVDEVTSITLDYQSRTSIMLARILAHDHWHIDVDWIYGTPGFEDRELKNSEAAVVIGDRSFTLAGQYPYVYDLAEEWKMHTGLPFVFAAWASNKSLSREFQKHFNDALEYGIAHIDESVDTLGRNQVIGQSDLRDYLKTNIQFRLDDLKMDGLQRFLNELTLLKDE